MAKMVPDSLMPRRLSRVMMSTATTAIGTRYDCEFRGGGDDGDDAGGDGDGDREDVADGEPGRRGQPGDVAEVVARDDVGAAAAGVGADRLAIGEGDDGEQRARSRWRCRSSA